jgi:hypothetical protein
MSAFANEGTGIEGFSKVHFLALVVIFELIADV